VHHFSNRNNNKKIIFTHCQ